ncbi:hypothetical protein [Marasmitruncus massiliensis]|uniref:hypothetical protein n=1 Tax=Marasmitruncus massiliensis TaxID=1944642 RepID=UPI000C7C21A5|nr:hypothetical protein [Marasmitruncus massiliensis]
MSTTIQESIDALTKASWIMNVVKHLKKIRTDTMELDSLNVTEQAGKCGLLLSKLLADKQEIITYDILRAFARQSGIVPAEINTYTDLLKKQEKVDFSKDIHGKISELEIYCFSQEDALETVNNIFEYLDPSELERSNICGLQATFDMPRTFDEYKNMLCNTYSMPEKIVDSTISIQDTFDLVKVNQIDNEKIYYNEYAFGGDIKKITKALNGVSASQRNDIEAVLKLIQEEQGYLNTNLEKKISSETIRTMEGVGLLNGITVESQHGNAVFYTTPHLVGVGIGANYWNQDIFHSAKLLLSCLRYGEYKSNYGRGSICSSSKMNNILNKLNRGDWVGPCTAIGQDYQLLEKMGVIQVTHSSGSMFNMRLRQKEVGELVQQMIYYGKKIDQTAVDNSFYDSLPSSFVTPEERRTKMEANKPKPILKIQSQILESLRTGGALR